MNFVNPWPAARDRVVSAEALAGLAAIFHLLGDPNRLRIVCLCRDGPIAVGAIAERLDLSMSLVSHHLRLLRGARLLARERHGKSVAYRLDDAHVQGMLDDMLAHIAEAAER